jgi:hypothetical protein
MERAVSSLLTRVAFRKKICRRRNTADQGIHMLDMIYYFAGDFEEVKSFVSNTYWNTMLKTCLCHYEKPKGCVASCTQLPPSGNISLGLRSP